MKLRTYLHAPHLTRLGVGDAVEVIAKPIARILDKSTSILPKAMQTNIAECGGCRSRKERLNSMFRSDISPKSP